jgi:L-threonylcarbamoyladenylate synthase
MIINLTTENFESTVALANKIICDGGIVVAPFDTVYGFICNPKNNSAIEKIIELKNRPDNKTFGLAVAKIDDIRDYAEIKHEAFIRELTPGKYTFILPSISVISSHSEPAVERTEEGERFRRLPATLQLSNYCYRNNTIGVRIPDNKLILAIAKQFGPIAQTSANKSGQLNCFSLADLEVQFNKDELNKIDLVIDGGELEQGSASELWDLTGDKPVKIERN